jgi:hypothetical protein
MDICAWRGAPNDGSALVCGSRPGSVVVVGDVVVVVVRGGALVDVVEAA